ncbi:hypothetical protein F5Y16DRAFT_11711 [Xylariaceae sp. FL0255]|nr:hypothetical protein F5Y16DRAFT_11711 [Xylariaceae sp. FL0255]
MAENQPTASYSTDPALYIYTSLTAGSSHIVTATSRLETILRANRVPFKALDIATDEKARMLWGRRAGKDESGRLRKLPGLVQMGLVLGDLTEIEEWNEYGELKEHVTIYYDEFTIPSKSAAPPPVQMRPLNQPFPKTGVAASTATPSSTPATSASAPPAPPPLPTDKDKTKIPLSSPTTGNVPDKSTSGTPKKSTAPAPMRSLAEEAAQRAKQVNLERLREKVHGKKDATPSSISADKEKENKKPATEQKEAPLALSKEDNDQAGGLSKGVSALSLSSGAAALQSPTTGTWHSGMPAGDGGSQKPPLQSPTSGTWKAGSIDGVVTEHRGSIVVNASPEEIAAVEKAEAIPEVDSSEEEDEEDDDEDEDEDDEEQEEEEKPQEKNQAKVKTQVQKKEMVEEDDSDEEEDEDDEDSSDDDDDDSEEDEKEKKTVKK